MSSNIFKYVCLNQLFFISFYFVSFIIPGAKNNFDLIIYYVIELIIQFNQFNLVLV